LGVRTVGRSWFMLSFEPGKNAKFTYSMIHGCFTLIPSRKYTSTKKKRSWHDGTDSVV
jgi:hypothetical protein